MWDRRRGVLVIGISAERSAGLDLNLNIHCTLCVDHEAEGSTLQLVNIIAASSIRFQISSRALTY